MAYHSFAKSRPVDVFGLSTHVPLWPLLLLLSWLGRRLLNLLWLLEHLSGQVGRRHLLQRGILLALSVNLRHVLLEGESSGADVGVNWALHGGHEAWLEEIGVGAWLLLLTQVLVHHELLLLQWVHGLHGLLGERELSASGNVLRHHGNAVDSWRGPRLGSRPLLLLFNGLFELS